jgi:hypothetical protein
MGLTKGEMGLAPLRTRNAQAPCGRYYLLLTAPQERMAGTVMLIRQ